MSQDERLMDLEIKLAYLEKLVVDLDGVVREQATSLARLIKKLEERDAAADAVPIVDERPPHY